MNPSHVMGRRVVAFILDYLLLTAVLAGAFFALASHTAEAIDLTGTQLHFTFGTDTYYLQGGDATGFLGLELLVALLYGGVLQGLTGATVGKWACGVRVMRADGSHPGIGRGVLRWVLLIVDDFPYFIPMLTGFIVALSNDRRRRVGDMAADTYVVRAGTAAVPVAPAPAMFPTAVQAQVPAAPLPQQPAVPVPAPPAPPATPAGWYPDPSGQARLRYWDGARWTDHTAQ